MVQTMKYISQLQDKGFKSIEVGKLDHLVNIQNQAGQDFRLELIPRSKMTNVISPDGRSQQVRYSNMGDFSTKTADAINNWKPA